MDAGFHASGKESQSDGNDGEYEANDMWNNDFVRSVLVGMSQLILDA